MDCRWSVLCFIISHVSRNLFVATLMILLVGCDPKPLPPGEPGGEETIGVDAAAPMPDDASGVWQVQDEKREPFDIVLFPSGQAVSTWTKGSGKARGERGLWRRVDGRVIVYFDDGWTDVLSAANTGFVHKGYAPGIALDSKPTGTSPATRVDTPEAAFVGVWRLNREPDGSHQYINLQSTGSAMSTVGGGTEGRWELVGDAARCTWPDGWVDQISREEGAWQKTSWVGADTGTHADHSPATRAGETRFAIEP